MGSDRDKKKLMSIRHMEQALALLDAIDEGDLDPAAFLERAITRSKRELRESIRTPRVVRLNRTHLLRRRLLAKQEKREGVAAVGRRRS